MLPRAMPLHQPLFVETERPFCLGFNIYLKIDHIKMHQTILLRTTILVWTTEEKLFKRFLQPLTSYPLLSSALYPKLTVNGLS